MNAASTVASKRFFICEKISDKQLAQTGSFVAGPDYSIADMAIFPWVRIHRKQRVDLARFAHVARWHDQIYQRPAVARALALGKNLRADTLTDDARQALFGQTADTTRPATLQIRSHD